LAFYILGIAFHGSSSEAGDLIQSTFKSYASNPLVPIIPVYKKNR
jgi:hypothetical protein